MWVVENPDNPVIAPKGPFFIPTVPAPPREPPSVSRAIQGSPTPGYPWISKSSSWWLGPVGRRFWPWSLLLAALPSVTDPDPAEETVCPWFFLRPFPGHPVWTPLAPLASQIYYLLLLPTIEVHRHSVKVHHHNPSIFQSIPSWSCCPRRIKQHSGALHGDVLTVT